MTEIFFGVANPALLARLSAVSRSHSAPLPAVRKLGPVEVSPETRRAVLRALERNSTALHVLEGGGVRARRDQIAREVLARQKEREATVFSTLGLAQKRGRRAGLFAGARGEALSPVPQSGVAGQMTKLLTGQARFDPAAKRILENLGLTASGRNKPWRGPTYTENAEAQLDQPTAKALEPGVRERTDARRIRSA